MKLLERSDRYLSMFRITTEINQLMTDLMSYENRLDILKQEDGAELMDNCDLIRFYMDRIGYLMVEINVLNEELNLCHCDSSSHDNLMHDDACDDIVRMSGENLEGVELSDDEINDMVRSMTNDRMVEDEHESC